MASGKNFAGWISGELLTTALARVERDFGGNVSKYVVRLVEEDCRGAEQPEQIFDDNSDYLKRLVSVADATGLDPVTLMRATLGALVKHAEANGNKITLPLVIGARENSILEQGASVWTRLDQSERDALLYDAKKGHSWPQVLDGLKAERTHKYLEYHAAYHFLMSGPPVAHALAAEDSTHVDIIPPATPIPVEYPTRNKTKGPVSEPKKTKDGKSRPTPPLPEAGSATG